MAKKPQHIIDTDNLIGGLLASVSESEKELIDYRMSLAAKIIAGMRAKGWNRTEFAKQMKVQNSVVTKWLSGYNNFESDTLFEIGKKLGIQLLQLESQKEQAKVLPLQSNPVMVTTNSEDFAAIVPIENPLKSLRLIK